MNRCSDNFKAQTAASATGAQTTSKHQTAASATGAQTTSKHETAASATGRKEYVAKALLDLASARRILLIMSNTAAFSYEPVLRQVQSTKGIWQKPNQDKTK